MAQGIALVFDSGTTKALVDIQNRHVEAYGLTPVQSVNNYLPHITIIQAAEGVCLAAERVLRECLQACAAEDDFPAIRFTHPFYKPRGWYFLGVDKCRWLDTLHKAVFGRFKEDLIKGKIDRTKSIADYTEEEKENYLRYGYRYIGDAWAPHVTIGRTSHTEEIHDSASLLASYEQTFVGTSTVASALTVYEIGKSGGHAQTQMSFEIRSESEPTP